MRAIVILMFLAVSQGCLATSSGSYPIYVRPELPPLRWTECKPKFQCLANEDYVGLRVYSIKMEGLVDKYQKQVEIINGK